MNRQNRGHCQTIAAFLSSIVLVTTASARVQYPVAAAYEDSVRILVVYNFGAAGAPVAECPWYTTATTAGSRRVGTETWQFVTASLAGGGIKNIKSMYTTSAKVDSVKNAFGAGKAPHVLVHVNAGWGGTAGQNFGPVQEWALNNNVGFVAVGDDEMTTLAPSFPWIYQIDMWQPLGTGTSLREPGDRLYMVMAAEKDQTIDAAAYPNLDGVIRNARKIAGADTVDFKPVTTDGRCEADADVVGFAAQDQDKITFLAYEQGLRASDGSVVGNAWDYCVVTILQDTLPFSSGFALRRAVSLSMQPQFVGNEAAAQQIVYDAVMYASLVHTRNPPTPFPAVGIRGAGKRNAADMRFLAGTTVRITDVGGRTVYEGPAFVNGGLRNMTSRWKSGVYVVTATNSKSAGSATFIVSR